jgi:hypothetical protein
MPMIDRVLKTMDENVCRPDFAFHDQHNRARAVELEILCLHHNRSAIYVCNFCSLSDLERELGGALNPNGKIYAYLPGKPE